MEGLVENVKVATGKGEEDIEAQVVVVRVMTTNGEVITEDLEVKEDTEVKIMGVLVEASIKDTFSKDISNSSQELILGADQTITIGDNLIF